MEKVAVKKTIKDRNTSKSMSMSMGVAFLYMIGILTIVMFGNIYVSSYFGLKLSFIGVAVGASLILLGYLIAKHLNSQPFMYLDFREATPAQREEIISLYSGFSGKRYETRSYASLTTRMITAGIIVAIILPTDREMTLILVGTLIFCFIMNLVFSISGKVSLEAFNPKLLGNNYMIAPVRYVDKHIKHEYSRYAAKDFYVVVVADKYGNANDCLVDESLFMNINEGDRLFLIRMNKGQCYFNKMDLFYSISAMANADADYDAGIMRPKSDVSADMLNGFIE